MAALVAMAVALPVVALPTAMHGSVGVDWTLQATPATATASWQSVTYGDGLFVAVAQSGNGDLVMTSPDGVAWNARQATPAKPWQAVAYGAGRFVAVGGDPSTNPPTTAVMTSPDGVVWTSRTPAVDNAWTGVAYGNGRFVAVGPGPASGNRVMTSPDGITWESVTAPDSYWRAVAHANGLFVAVGGTGSQAGTRIMTSPNGTDWTARTLPSPSGNYYSVTHGNNTFMAVGGGGPGTPATGVIMTSPDGITWTARSNPTGSETNSWRGVAYGDGQFVVVARQGPTRVATSPDGITWTTRGAPSNSQWYSVGYANNVFVSLAQDGAGAQVMTSGTLFPAVPAMPVALADDARATVTAAQGIVGLGTGGPVSSFTITASPGGATCTATPSGGGSCTLTGLTNGTPYTFTATATNAAGTSAASAPSTAVTPTGRPSTAIPRLPVRISCTAGLCVTTGRLPTGATRVTQVAGSSARLTSAAVAPARTTEQRSTGRCTTRPRPRAAAGTFRCTIRLTKGTWLIGTEARSSAATLAKSVKRVRIARVAAPAVAG